MNGSDAPFGFGQNVAISTTTPVTVTSKDQLRSTLATANTSTTGTGTVILVDGNANADFDFKGEDLAISGQKIAIRLKPGSKAVLRNVLFSIKLDTADDILLEDLVFRSNGGGKPTDAIRILATAPAPAPVPPATGPPPCKVRITHCSFDGYSDITIDTKTLTGRPRLLATIDHCLFFDARPGQEGRNNTTFVDRGAINVASLQPDRGNGAVTIAFNVYIDVWRRLPRVGGGNFVHVFNNLLYRWGYTKKDSNNETWRGMEIGGGDLTTDNGKALIEANRFIPWKKKVDITREIAFNEGTEVDLSATTNPNEFDTPEGTPVAAGVTIPTVPLDQVATFTRAGVYEDVGLADPGAPAQATAVDWKMLVQQAGSRVLVADSRVKRGLKGVLKRAAR